MLLRHCCWPERGKSARERVVGRRLLLGLSCCTPSCCSIWAGRRLAPCIPALPLFGQRPLPLILCCRLQCCSWRGSRSARRAAAARLLPPPLLHCCRLRQLGPCWRLCLPAAAALCCCDFHKRGRNVFPPPLSLLLVRSLVAAPAATTCAVLSFCPWSWHCRLCCWAGRCCGCRLGPRQGGSSRPAARRCHSSLPASLHVQPQP